MEVGKKFLDRLIEGLQSEIVYQKDLMYLNEGIKYRHAEIKCDVYENIQRIIKESMES